jgi:polar amino acid transport system substrate-binding protein
MGLVAAAGAGIAALVFWLSQDREKTFRWGGDKNGGAPYIFEDARGNLSGFEVELAEYLAAQLGLRSEFVQGQWDKLTDGLSRGDFDVVLNGYEWSAEREKRWPSTIPYYIYRLQLQARTSDKSIGSWEDLHLKPGREKKRIGVLIGTTAERYLQQRFGNEVVLKSFNSGVTDVMGLVERNQDLDATVQDLPAVIYYEREFPRLHRVGAPVEPGYYVMYVRPGDDELRERLNGILRKANDDGKLRAIYEKYGLWDDEQTKLKTIAAQPWPPQETAVGAPRERGSWLFYGWELIQAAGMTVLLTCLAMPLAMAIGLLVAVGRLYGPWWVRGPLGVYVEFLRGTPLLLQLYVIYYVAPSAGILLPAFWAAILGLAINYSAYEAENYRAGLLAIPRGQMEAALALGMSKWTALRRVIIPQAVRIVIPPVTNDFIALFKDTSVCSVIAVAELTGRYNQLYNNNPDLVLELGLMTALLYLLMSYPLSLVARRLERRFPRVAV